MREWLLWVAERKRERERERERDACDIGRYHFDITSDHAYDLDCASTRCILRAMHIRAWPLKTQALVLVGARKRTACGRLIHASLHVMQGAWRLSWAVSSRGLGRLTMEKLKLGVRWSAYRGSHSNTDFVGMLQFASRNKRPRWFIFLFGNSSAAWIVDALSQAFRRNVLVQTHRCWKRGSGDGQRL